MIFSPSPYTLLQNSRDNMSVILVAFPAAPKKSEEAVEEVSCWREGRGREFYCHFFCPLGREAEEGGHGCDKGNNSK